MSGPPLGQGSFRAFSDLLTGYRASLALMVAHGSGLFERLGGHPLPATVLCRQLGWEEQYGRRMLECLCAMAILSKTGEGYRIDARVAALLDPASPFYQGAALDFESGLLTGWLQLERTLQAGCRIHGKDTKAPDELDRARKCYLGAMDGAAQIRAKELWDCVEGLPQQGRLLDVGAGSGAFVGEFLQRYQRWSAIYCDLPDIVDNHALHPGLHAYATRVSWCGCNLLSDEPSPWDQIEDHGCDLVLLSNLIHCQGAEETRRLLVKAFAKVAVHGRICIHDFFADGGSQGALYDLHMMINTYNGRTYAIDEILDMLAGTRSFVHALYRLPSGSSLLVVQGTTPSGP